MKVQRSLIIFLIALLNNLEFNNFSGLQATRGAKLQFTIITLHVGYPYANNNLLTAGLGVSIR